MILFSIADNFQTSIGSQNFLYDIKMERIQQKIKSYLEEAYVGGMHAVRPLQINLFNKPVLQNMEWKLYGTGIVLRFDIVRNKK